MTPYQQWQIDRYGNILEVGDTHHMVDEDSDQDQRIEDQIRRIEEMAEIQLMQYQ